MAGWVHGGTGTWRHGAMAGREWDSPRIQGFAQGRGASWGEGEAKTLIELIYGGVLEAYPNINVVIGESGIGWIPYILDRMDLEWEE